MPSFIKNSLLFAEGPVLLISKGRMVLLLCLKMGKTEVLPKGLRPELHETRGPKYNQTRLKLFPPTKWKKGTLVLDFFHFVGGKKASAFPLAFGVSAIK